MSASKNTERACVGRMRFVGLKKFEEERWNQLLQSYQHLHSLNDERVKRYAISRSRLNPVTNLYELPPSLLSDGGELIGTLKKLHCKEIEMMEDGTYYEPRKDVVTEVISKGRHHRGRTRLVSNRLGATVALHPGKRKKKSLGVKKAKEQMSSVIRLPDIESLSTCDLLWQFDDSFPDIVLGYGQVYPTCERTLRNRPIHDDYVKVHVDAVNENYKSYPVPKYTKNEDEVTDMASTEGQFIQWPRKAIKLLNTDSSCQSIAQHQHPPQHSECYTSTLYEERHMPYDNELESGMRFVDLLTNPVLKQPTHPKHVLDPKASMLSSPVLKQPTHTEHVVDLKASKVVHDHKASKLANPVSIQPTHTESILLILKLLRLFIILKLLRYLYRAGRFEGLHNTIYFNRRMVELSVCNTYEQFAIDHIKEVIGHHKNKQYFMTPYLAGAHWMLIVIFHNPKDQKFYGYIIDSLKKGKNFKNYVITEVIRKTIGECITWRLVKCHQQVGGWECGYYVMKAMHDIVIMCKEKIIFHNDDPLWAT